jgi:hypothetical protein
MKLTTIAFVLLFGALSASADDAGRIPVATFTAASGHVSPEFAYVKQCQIFRDHVLFTMTGPVIHVMPYSTGVTYTPEVPDYETADQLVRKAFHGKIVEGEMGPTDGPTQSFEGVLPLGWDGSQTVTLRTKGNRNFFNLSPATKPLIRFIRANCADAISF